jgi:hypothetical protein
MRKVRLSAGFAKRTDRWIGVSATALPRHLRVNTGCGDRRPQAPARIEGRPGLDAPTQDEVASSIEVLVHRQEVPM